MGEVKAGKKVAPTKKNPSKNGTGTIGVTGEGGSHEPPFLFDPSLPLENERHERFCLELLAGKSQTQAYLRSFPDSGYDSARAHCCRLVADGSIEKRLAFLREEQKTRLKMSADEVLQGLTMAARFDIADLYDSTGAMIPVHELPPEVRLCLERIEYDEIFTGEGKNRKVIGRTAKVHAMSKHKALELLAKHHKLLTDKFEVTVKRSLEEILDESAGGES
jgi:phage terminase small subunit